jgi:hypothetical protein
MSLILCLRRGVEGQNPAIAELRGFRFGCEEGGALAHPVFLRPLFEGAISMHRSGVSGRESNNPWPNT